MKGLILTFILMLGFGAFVGAHAQRTETVRVQVNTEKRAYRSGLRIRFLEMVDDSRCPIDVDCVTAGNARIRVRVSTLRRSKELSLNTNTRTTATFAGYRLRLTNLTPKPRSNIRINRNGYVAVISVARM